MPIRSVHGCVALLLATCTTLALAAPPAPQVSARANGVKQLRFDWNAVSGATSYELWFRSGANATPSRFFQLPGSQRSVVNNVSVHLLDWNNARYWVNACDATGCTSSSPLSVSNLMTDTIGLFASPSQQTASQFGFAVAISGDGTTLAAAAPFEATDDARFPKGSAYIYRRSGAAWVFHSAIPFDVARDARTINPVLSLNGAGTVLAIGLPRDAHHGAQSTIGFGSAKVFRFVEGNGWRQDATIAMTTSQEFDSARQLQLDAVGNTLAVKTSLGDSGVYIYTYDSAGTWSHTGTAFGRGLDINDGRSCGQFALSADGRVLAYACGSFDPSDLAFEVHAAPGWGVRDTLPIPAGATFIQASALDVTGDALALSVSTAGDNRDLRTEVYRRVNGSYQREAVLRPGAWEINASIGFGTSAEFSGDGKLLAVSDPGDHGVGIGALSPPLTAGAQATGAVYVFERRSNGWNLRRVVKPGRAGFETGTFGRDIAFGDNGKALVVGQPGANNNSGVAWLY